MADFAPALQFLLDNEDRNRQYAIVSDDCPGGCPGPCHAISGINSGAFPADYAAVVVLPQAGRGPAVASFYERRFWNPMGLGEIDSQDLATRVLDCAVNGGAGTAIRLLQEAANACGGSLTVDGAMGTLTLAAVNQADPEAMLNAYRQQRLHRYIAIAQNHPADAPYLKGWEARALA